MQKQLVGPVIHRQKGSSAKGKKIHRIKHELSQYTGEDGRDTKGRMQKPRYRTGQCAGKERGNNTEPHGYTRRNKHGADAGSRTDGAIHGKIRNIKKFVGDVDADGHQSPDKPFRNSAGQGVQKCHSNLRNN